MTERNIFELAAKKKLRFPTPVGTLTVEQLYDLPLQSSTHVSLNSIAIATNRELKDASEESFVQTKPNALADELELKLDIVKHVIADKLESKKRAEERAERAERRRKILDKIAEAEDKELGTKSKEELLKELAQIDEEA